VAAADFDAPTGLRRKTLRCAIYTRKSTEEGLEQTFNTLDAQRDAAEAYIRSQREEVPVDQNQPADSVRCSEGTREAKWVRCLQANFVAIIGSRQTPHPELDEAAPPLKQSQPHS
jgi:hypothetical protein